MTTPDSEPSVKGEDRVIGAKIRVLLVDDHRIVREGLRSILENQEDMIVIAEASDGVIALDQARATHPDVVLMDLNMPIMNGLEATRRITTALPQITVIGLSTYDDHGTTAAFREAGAADFFSKGKSFDTLCATIRERSAPAPKDMKGMK